MTTIAFREVRRLRFIRLACDIIVDARSLQIGLASSRLLEAAKRYDSARQKSYRVTGKISSAEIAQNYIDIAGALGLLRIQEGIAEPTAPAVALSTFDDTPHTMALSLGERVQFLEQLLTVEPCAREVRAILSKLAEANELAPSDFLDPKSNDRVFLDTVRNDRVVKSHLEWLADLKLVGATRPTRGNFHITNLGRELARVLETAETNLLLPTISTYVADEIGVVKPSLPGNETLRSAVVDAAERVRKRVASPIDPKLVAAEPVLLVARLILLTQSKCYVSFAELLDAVESRARTWRILFSWNRAYKSGHFRFP